jgi:phage protein D
VTAPSPTQSAGSVASFTIVANGKPLDPSVQVISIDVWTGVNKVPKARLVVSDGSAAEETFPISETEALIPGAALDVSIGYDGHDTAVFSGVIYRQGLDVTQNGPSRLVVEATDKAMAMTLARQNAIYENMTDSQVMEKLLGAQGLAKDVTATSAAHPVIVQYYCTDWDLLVIRAQLNSMVVMADVDKVTVAPPDTGKPPVLTLTYGDSILAFRADMDASTQFTQSAIQSFAWDPATQALLTSQQASAEVTEPGNIPSAELAKVFNVTAYAQQTGGSLDQQELTAWSSAELLKTRLAKIRGQVRYQGSALAKVGSMVTLAGLGDRFDGDAYVSGVHHSVTDRPVAAMVHRHGTRCRRARRVGPVAAGQQPADRHRAEGRCRSGRGVPGPGQAAAAAGRHRGGVGASGQLLCLQRHRRGVLSRGGRRGPARLHERRPPLSGDPWRRLQQEEPAAGHPRREEQPEDHRDAHEAADRFLRGDEGGGDQHPGGSQHTPGR